MSKNVGKEMWRLLKMERLEIPEEPKLISLVISMTNEESLRGYSVVVVSDKDAPAIDFHSALRTAVHALGQAIGVEPADTGSKPYDKTKHAH